MKKIALLLISIMSINLLSAGDKAEFVNLGFSSDGKYFMFGNYGFSQDESQCYSNIYIVDLAANVFVPQGIYSGEYRNILSPGQSAMGALFSLMEESSSSRRDYAIDYLNTGRPLFIRLDDNPESQENIEQEINTLDFKDFLTGNHFDVVLNQTIEGNSSRFYIDLSIQSADGLSKNVRVGHPNYSRQGIIDYTINRIIISPDNQSLVIIIGKTDVDGNIRYMVETVEIF